MTNLQRNVKAFIEKQGGYVGAAAKLKVTAVSLQMFMLGNRCYAKTLERIGRVGKDGVLLKTSAFPAEAKAPKKTKAKARKAMSKGSSKAKRERTERAKAASKRKAPKTKAAAKAKTKPRAKAKKADMNGVPASAPPAEPPVAGATPTALA